ncbi:MAG: class I SAM-dependent methyltransferase, partial [Desulfobacteraceae bacterium]
GIDPSTYMLDKAADKFKDRVTLHKGSAEDLPFEDNSFEYSIMFTSLEFTERPAKAIEEACRVTKDKIFIGVLNRYAPTNIIRRVKGYFRPNIYSHARFFGIWELRQILFAILGKVPITWKTTLQMPCFSGRIPGFCEDIRLVQKSPFGTMIGMKIEPVPRFRTRPLALKIKTRKSYKPATGMARTMKGVPHGNADL